MHWLLHFFGSSWYMLLHRTLEALFLSCGKSSLFLLLLVYAFLTTGLPIVGPALGAPLATLLGYKFSHPLVAEVAPYHHVETCLLPILGAHDLESTVVTLALGFNCMNYFDAVVADVEFVIKVPELQGATRALNLLLLLTAAHSLLWELYSHRWWRLHDWLFVGLGGFG